MVDEDSSALYRLYTHPSLGPRHSPHTHPSAGTRPSPLIPTLAPYQPYEHWPPPLHPLTHHQPQPPRPAPPPAILHSPPPPPYSTPSLHLHVAEVWVLVEAVLGGGTVGRTARRRILLRSCSAHTCSDLAHGCAPGDAWRRRRRRRRQRRPGRRQALCGEYVTALRRQCT